MTEDRQETAGRVAQTTGAIVALKGAGTVVTDGRRIYVNDTGNPGMATAGSGDVLTGIVTALRGQGLDSFQATVLGVYLHGLAGDIAAERLGQASLMATDIVEALPEAFQHYLLR
jgi:NAD(P)H-hydrate epimerase